MSNFMEKLSARWQDGINFLLGLWLIVSPWVLGYTADTWPAWNSYVVGAVIAILAAISLTAHQKWEHWATLAVAAWLIVSPWVLDYTALQTVFWNHIITGVIVGALALWTMAGDYGFGGAEARS